MMAYGERINVKTRRELDCMREAARHVAEILLEMREMAKPGVTTGEINTAAERSIDRRGVGSSFKGYGPHGMPAFPAVVCVSLNEEIVHGIPGSRELENGDILSLDFGVHVNGFHGDSAVTIPIGEIDDESRALLETTRASLYCGIEQMVSGNRVSDIGHAVQKRMPSPPATRWCASSWATALVVRCTSRRRSPTSARRARAPACARHGFRHRADGLHGRLRSGHPRGRAGRR